MAVLGTILGDIAGSWLEENRRFVVEKMGAIDWDRYPLYTKECSCTDDTVMTLAVKKAIDTGADFVTTMQDVGRQHAFCGYGKTFNKWIQSDNPKPYGSYGNGSAMRVSYIAEYYNTIEEVRQNARKSALVSHNHPEGVKGAVVTAVCIWKAKVGLSKDEILEYCNSQYPAEQYKYSASRTLADMRDEYTWSVTCQDSVPLAVRCFYESNSYEDFIRKVFSFNCDTDTIAAIGGGIAEEYYHKTFDNADEILRRFLSEDLYNIFLGKY